MNAPPTDDFKYDIAFSFLSRDEGTATRLNDLLKTRLRTFIYTEHQKTVAGTDGEQTFSEAFALHSRLVAILYRPEWGTTKWTRVEKEAIRGRAHEQGYDFTIMIPMEPGIHPPAWYPRYRLWVSADRWGDEGAAAVLEARATEMGSEVREETLPEFAKRLIDTIARKQARKDFLNGEVGVRAAKEAFAALPTEIAELGKQIEDQLRVQISQEGDRIAVLASQCGLSVTFKREFANSLDKSSLLVETWKGRPPSIYRPSIYDDPSKRIGSISGQYDYASIAEHGWRIGDDTRIYGPKVLADYLLRRLLDAEIKTL